MWWRRWARPSCRQRASKLFVVVLELSLEMSLEIRIDAILVHSCLGVGVGLGCLDLQLLLFGGRLRCVLPLLVHVVLGRPLALSMVCRRQILRQLGC